MRACFHSDQNLRAKTQKSLSIAVSLGLGCFRFRVASCWRRARLSRSSCRRPRKRRRIAPARSLITVIICWCYRDSLVDGNPYPVEITGGQSFGEAHLLSTEKLTAFRHILGTVQYAPRICLWAPAHSAPIYLGCSDRLPTLWRIVSAKDLVVFCTEPVFRRLFGAPETRCNPGNAKLPGSMGRLGVLPCFPSSIRTIPRRRVAWPLAFEAGRVLVAFF
jgi:hypothetical protein